MDENLILTLELKIDEAKKTLDKTEDLLKVNLGPTFDSSDRQKEIDKFRRVLEKLEKYIKKEKEKRKERSQRYQEARDELHEKIETVNAVSKRLWAQNCFHGIFEENLNIEDGYQENTIDAFDATNGIATISNTLGGYNISTSGSQVSIYNLVYSLRNKYGMETVDLENQTDKMELNSHFFSQTSSMVLFRDISFESNFLVEDLKNFETPDPYLQKDQEKLEYSLGGVVKEMSNIGNKNYSPSVINGMEDNLDMLIKQQENDTSEEQEEELARRMEQMAERIERDTDKIIISEVRTMAKKISKQLDKLDMLMSQMDSELFENNVEYIRSQINELLQMLDICKSSDKMVLKDILLELKDKKLEDLLQYYHSNIANQELGNKALELETYTDDDDKDKI